MKKNPAKKKTAAKAQPAGRFCKRVPPDHPIYRTGYVVGGRYPARKPTQLDKIADKLATERNADPADEDIQRDAVFQAAADRTKAPKPAPTGFAAQLAGTLEQMIAEAAGDPASEEVLKKLRRNLTGESS